MTKIKKPLVIFLILVFASSLASCGYFLRPYKGYGGEHPDLYSIAINSLLWTTGISQTADRFADSEIIVLEEDAYGRILFSYWEKSYHRKDLAPYSLLIGQKTDGDYVYFYPDHNFISVERDPFSLKTDGFSEDEIGNLKRLNDWNEEIDLDKCVKVEITNKKPKPQISKEVFDLLIKKAIGYEGEATLFRYADHVSSDNYGRSIYCCFGIGSWKDTNTIYLVFIFNPDGSYNEETCILDPSDYYNYQDELKAFKELNHWNEPWE